MKSGLIILLVMISANVFAGTGYSSRIKYWYSNNVSTNVPKLNTIVKMQDNLNGQGVQFTWKIENPPSKAVLDALDPAVVEDFIKDKDADPDKSTIDTQAIMGVIAELTGTPIKDVKKKFKKAKKEKEKNK